MNKDSCQICRLQAEQAEQERAEIEFFAHCYEAQTRREEEASEEHLCQVRQAQRSRAKMVLAETVHRY
jgi:hypothetical protein